MSNAIAIITGDIYGAKDAFQQALAAPSIKFEAEAGFAIQILSKSEYALGMAMKNRQSVVDAVTNVAAIGISLNPAKKQAYLVPRDNQICLDISYMGLIDLAVECGSIMWAQANLVYASEIFEVDGFDKPPIHKRKPLAKDKGELIGAYVVAKTPDGDYLTEVMSISEIYDVRDRSSAWKAWISKQKKCPWVTDEGEMCRKTLVKRGSKYWPRVNSDERLARAVHHLNTEGEEGLAEVRTPAANAADAFDLSGFIAQANAATNEADLTKVYATAMQAAVDANDKQGAVTFKNAAMARRTVLREQNTVDMESTQ
jgi:recombination protein RecT